MNQETRTEDMLRTEGEAFLPGANLWITADLERSLWAQKIDWYLNFQILRSATHQTPQPSPDLKAIMQRWDFEPVSMKPPGTSSPLLVSSSNLLPNHMVLLVPYEDGEGSESVLEWTRRVHEGWLNLNSPSLRIFLPIGVDTGQFLDSWPGPFDVLKRSLVVERGNG